MKFFFLLICVFLLSCSQEEMTRGGTQSPVEKHSPYYVSQEEALEKLRYFLNHEDSLATSNAQQRVIRDIYTVRSVKTNVKSSSQESIDLVHVVNFEQEKGFAILSADSRISGDILVVTEQGSITEREILYAIENDNRVLYEEYPLNGPGLIYSQDSMFVDMNPNTFNLYNQELNDYLVGDFDDSGLSPIGLVVEGGSQLIGYWAVQYVSNQINEHMDEPIFDGSADSGLPKLSTETTEEVTYRERVSPLLYFARYWSQNDPFNREFPLVREFLVGRQKRASAGCVPLAISKMMAFHRKPSNISYNGGPNVNWDALIAADTLWKYPSLLNVTLCESASSLLKAVADSCGSICFYSGTFTFPKCARQYMARHYSAVKFDNYNTTSVTAALNRGIPIFVCSLPEGGPFYQLEHSHAWNIDGYKTKTTKRTIKYFLDGVYDRTEEEYETDVMVHCDFGWSGHCNGYYISGMFNLSVEDNSDIELDNPADTTGKDRNYIWRIKTITHNGPI